MKRLQLLGMSDCKATGWLLMVFAMLLWRSHRAAITVITAVMTAPFFKADGSCMELDLRHEASTHQGLLFKCLKSPKVGRMSCFVFRLEAIDDCSCQLISSTSEYAVQDVACAHKGCLRTPRCLQWVQPASGLSNAEVPTAGSR